MRLASVDLQGSRRSGSAFVITLWVAFGLVSLALYFGHSMSLELKASENRVAAVAADQAIEGAARYASYLLSNLETPGMMPSVQGYVHEAVPVGDATFWFIGRDPDQDTPTLPYFSLDDDSGRLDINTATQTMLEALPRMTPSLAAAIIDWRDADSEVTSGGAEDETYLRRNPPHRAKNGNFESLDELKLVFGMDAEVLYGEDANQNGILDSNENDGDANLPKDNQDGRLDPGILEYLTVRPTSTSTAISGAGGATAVAGVRVNANTASEVVLSCLPGIEKTGASALIAYRRSHVDQLSTAEWFTNALSGDGLAAARNFLTNGSALFRADVAALGQNGRGYRRQRFVFDLSAGTPRIASRQDLTSLGWALGRNARQSAMTLTRTP